MDATNNPEDVAACWEANAETWTRQARAGYDVYRDALNTPAFLAALPDINGLEGLDVGCGEGANTRHLARRGAVMHAIDIAPTFIRHARETEDREPLGISYSVADATVLPFADARFDFAAAFMSLMDVPAPLRTLSEIARVLRPGGFLQFSILHPCFAPPHRKVVRGDDGAVHAIQVAKYFETGSHSESWWFGRADETERRETGPFRVPYVHLTLPQWIDGVHDAGLRLLWLKEPSASEELARRVPEVADTRVAPLFLHVRAEKPRGL